MRVLHHRIRWYHAYGNCNDQKGGIMMKGYIGVHLGTTNRAICSYEEDG